MRVPLGKRAAYQNALGLADEITLQDPRVWRGHFPADDVEASKQGSGPCGTNVVVKLVEGAIPSQTDEHMSAGTKGQLLSALRRSNAIKERHRQSLLDASMTDVEKDARIQELQDRVNMLEKTIRELTVDGKQQSANREEDEEAPGARSSRIDDSILEGKRDEAARSLCGLRSAESLKNLYNFLNIGGVAENMNFYNANPVQAEGVKEDGRRVLRRPKKLGGTNGLFFVLFVLRTGTSIRVASTLFGVSDSTGGRAFTGWLDLLANSLRPLVRLPDVGSVVSSAPPNFEREGLSSVAVVLDGTEIWCEKVWQSDAQHALWSQYKKRYTAKILIGIIPAGAICYVSDAYVGRTSDVELVRQCGIVEELTELGFGGKGMHVMADRGFNAMAPLLIDIGMHYVAPPSKRKGEHQFNEEDASVTREVANLRIHVQRAIGAMKQWRILETKFDSQQMDNIGEIALVCAAMVNLTRKPFASAK